MQINMQVIQPEMRFSNKQYLGMCHQLKSIFTEVIIPQTGKNKRKIMLSHEVHHIEVTKS